MTSDFRPVLLEEDAKDPSVVLLPDGAKLLVWSENDIFGRRYDQNGMEVSTFLIKT